MRTGEQPIVFAILLAMLTTALLSAATITVTLREPNSQKTEVDPQHVAINVGDSIQWILMPVTTLYTNYTNFVRSVGGEFESPPLMRAGDRFSVTFTNSGFFAYRTPSRFSNDFADLGTITVQRASQSAPAVTINAPVDGFVFAQTWRTFPLVILASAEQSTSEVDHIEFFEATNPLGKATNPPYSIPITSLPSGQHSFFARAIKQNGSSSVSKLVTIAVKSSDDPSRNFSFFHVLPQGQLLFNIIPPGIEQHNDFFTSEDLIQWRFLRNVGVPVTFVDPSVTNSAHRFYRIRLSPLPN